MAALKVKNCVALNIGSRSHGNFLKREVVLI